MLSTQNKLFGKMKNKILPIFLQRNYRESVGEFSSTSFSVLGAERVKGWTARKVIWGSGGGLNLCNTNGLVTNLVRD